MSDLTKILLSAATGWALGLISGILLEPFKAWYVRQFTAKRARKDIYKEFADVYFRIVVLGKQWELNPSYMKLNIEEMRTEVFDFYYEQHRDAVYKIPEWKHLQGFSESIKEKMMEFKNNNASIAEIVDGFEQEIALLTRFKMFDSKLFNNQLQKLRARQKASELTL